MGTVRPTEDLLAVCSAIGNSRSSVCCTRAGLVGTVTDTEAESLVAAVAGGIAGGATEGRLGDLEHVADAGLL